MSDLPSWYLHISAFILGACVGSFLNVVIYRLPMGKSLVRPGSGCPECGSPVRAMDNVPILSWLVLMGLCRDCGAPISARYILVELLTGVLTLAVVVIHGAGPEALFYLVLAWCLVAVTFIDLEFQIIPDELSVGGVAAGLLASSFLSMGLKGALLGVLAGGGIFFALAIAYPGGMGGGDIKLMAAIGAFLGWKLALLTIVTGSVLGAAAGLSAMAFFGKGRKSRIPFGPFLAAGGIVSILWGERIIGAYLAAFGPGTG
ncbi:MAG: prepilin peptidase [Candidatus Nitrospinota bacterium M3_3B_026]